MLDPDAHAAAAAFQSLLPGPLHTLGVQAVRELLTTPPSDSPSPSVGVVENRFIHTKFHAIPVRIYRTAEAAVQPALLYIHGGGWTLGTLDGVDSLCRELCNQANCTVVSVDYRLAPEHPFPAALDDCVAAFAWLHDRAPELRIDSDRIAIGGDSAGGNLAIAVCLAARNGDVPLPVHQLLAYPATDFASDRTAWSEHADAPLLTAQDARWFMSLYAPDRRDHRNPLISPMAAASLTGLPPAHVITAAVDVLRDDAEAYAERLRSDGVPATLARYPGVFHGFFTEVGSFARTTEAIAEAARELRVAFTSMNP
ncbi:alpha/beta hydrolase [Nocardia miyunensis]|uniref:alpha/beta hydrolase n=1 Tax=Nocardia miyunensis TaxID=282684 RepID=UPI00082BC362|nr:alpha/beta hydrolase [Nocardia miyunensis]